MTELGEARFSDLGGEQRRASPRPLVRLTDRLATMATAKTDCAAVTNSSTRCTVSRGRPWRTPANIEKTMGSVPTSSVHWLTLEEMRAPKPVRLPAARRTRRPPAVLGASEAVGAIHLTRRNSLTPDRLTHLDDGVGERLGAEQDHSRRRSRTWRS